MAMRRARFKPTANLSLKRPATTNRPAILRASQVKQEKEDAPTATPPVIKTEPLVVPKKETDSKPPPSPQNSATNPTPPPPQFIPPRPSPTPSPSHAPSTPHHQHVARSPAHPIDDGLFKSPIMSPSYPPMSRTPNPYHGKVMSPNPLYVPPMDHSPASPSKQQQQLQLQHQQQARHRIRAVPVLATAQRKPNTIAVGSSTTTTASSVHGEENQNPIQSPHPTDESPAPSPASVHRIPHQRVRHISTSSTTSVTKFVPQQVGRIRTESTCSAYSDVSVFKPRRAGKSEEYSRLCDARRELLKKCNGEAPLKSQLRMYDMIYYNPKTNPMKKPTVEEGTGPDGVKRERRLSTSTTTTTTKVVREDEFKEEEAKKKEAEAAPQETAMPVPQLKLGPNGEMVLDEKSLTIEMTGEREARERIANADIVYDDLHSNHGFYKRHQRTRDWPHDETIRFYRCLQVIGTDFSLMNVLFPNRSRRDLKLKFKKEEKTNGFLVNKALIEHTSFDIEELKETFRKEDEIREAELKEQQEEQKKANEGRSVLSKQIKARVVNRPSRTERATLNMDVDLEHVDVKALRQHKPRKLKGTTKPKDDDDPLKIDSPFSVPPASPCKTPSYPAFPQSPQVRQSPQKRPQTPGTPGSELYYYDMDLKGTTRGKRKMTESDTRDPIEILAPKSVEIMQEDEDEDDLPLKPFVVKVEKEEKKKETEAAEGEDPLALDEEEGGDDADGDDDLDGLDLSNLVVMMSENAKGEKVYKVHLIDAETNEVSEEPLDLPKEVIEYIVEAHEKQVKQQQQQQVGEE